MRVGEGKQVKKGREGKRKQGKGRNVKK